MVAASAQLCRDTWQRLAAWRQPLAAVQPRAPRATAAGGAFDMRYSVRPALMLYSSRWCRLRLGSAEQDAIRYSGVD